MVFSDGVLEAHEDALMHKMATLLGVRHEELMALKVKVQNEGVVSPWPPRDVGRWGADLSLQGQSPGGGLAPCSTANLRLPNTLAAPWPIGIPHARGSCST